MKKLWTGVVCLWMFSGLRAEEPPRVTAEPPRAWTKGIFDIRYDLVKDDKTVIAKNVRVTVNNQTHLPTDASRRLREHEEMHKRINETAAARIEKEMAEFRKELAGDAGDMKKADNAFRREFRKKIKATDELHKEWDYSHIPE
jgi:hypothetical protein